MGGSLWRPTAILESSTRQTTRRTYQFGFVVAALGLAAWLPSVRPYIPVADDYALAERFTSLQAMGSWVRDNGIQRIGQFPTAWLLMRKSSLAPSLIALTLHISVCLAFFLVCARLLGPSPALAISSVFAAWPSGFEAILWTGACLPCLLSALVFWVSVLVVLETPKRSSHQFICGASIATLVLFTS